MDSVAHQEAAHYKVPGKRSTEYMDSLNRECREEDASAKRELLDHREDSYDSKARSSPPKMKGMNGNPQYSKKGNRMGYPQNKMMSRGPYGPPMGHPGAPQYGPPLMDTWAHLTDLHITITIITDHRCTCPTTEGPRSMGIWEVLR